MNDFFEMETLRELALHLPASVGNQELNFGGWAPWFKLQNYVLS